MQLAEACKPMFCLEIEILRFNFFIYLLLSFDNFNFLEKDLHIIVIVVRG